MSKAEKGIIFRTCKKPLQFIQKKISWKSCRKLGQGCKWLIYRKKNIWVIKYVESCPKYRNENYNMILSYY